jgi:hypothetical protein
LIQLVIESLAQVAAFLSVPAELVEWFHERIGGNHEPNVTTFRKLKYSARMACFWLPKRNLQDEV